MLHTLTFLDIFLFCFFVSRLYQFRAPMFIDRHFIIYYVCLCVIVISLRSDSDRNKEATYLLTYLLTINP